MSIPLPVTTLDANPGFARLWETITGEILEKDASSRRAEKDRRRRWKEQLAAGRVNRQESGVAADQERHEVTNQLSEEGGKLHEEMKDPSLVEELNRLRMNEMKVEILRELLREVAYCDYNTNLLPKKHDDETYETEIPASPQPQADTKASENNVSRKQDGLEGQHVENLCKVEGTRTQQKLGSQTDSWVRLRDTLLVVSSYLAESRPVRELTSTNSTRNLSSNDRDMIADNIIKFEENVASIARAVGRALATLEQGLSEMAQLAMPNDGLDDETDDTSSHIPSRFEAAQQRTSPSLVETLLRQTTYLTSLRQITLPIKLCELSSILLELLSTQRELLSYQIRTLESTKHGVLSRHAQSRTSFLAAVAEAMDLKTRILILEERKRFEIGAHVERRRAYFKDKMRDLGEEERALDSRVAQLQGILEEYEHPEGVRGMEVMEKLGSRYGQIEREIETVREDIRRLEARRTR